MDMPMQGGPMQAEPDQPATEAAPGGDSYEICIYVTPAGLSVSKEPLDPSSEQGESKGQPVASIGEALKAVLTMYQGTSHEAGIKSFQAGFKEGQGGARG